ncbi:MAG: hypothetical protein AAFU80_03815 [Pseudomonadota bacterium]
MRPFIPAAAIGALRPFLTVALALALPIAPVSAQEQLSPGPSEPPAATIEPPAGDEAPRADAAEPAMSVDRLWALVQAVDPEALRRGAIIQLAVEDVPVLIVTDPSADRMRAMVPIRTTDGMTAGEYRRVLEANFDTALDARYAIARGQLWAAFIHPLSALNRAQFLSGLGQTVNIALSYGDTYSSGEMTFLHGDTGDRQRKLLQDLLRKGEEL